MTEVMIEETDEAFVEDFTDELTDEALDHDGLYASRYCICGGSCVSGTKCILR
jgi:hypothetical protein